LTINPLTRHLRYTRRRYLLFTPKLRQRRNVMAQKVIDVVGVSKESFAKAAENAVAEAAKTVRGLKWARVADLEMELDGKKIAQYRATTKIYFDIEK
jgi:flavin-binding protein dodecin